MYVESLAYKRLLRFSDICGTICHANLLQKHKAHAVDGAIIKVMSDRQATDECC